MAPPGKCSPGEKINSYRSFWSFAANHLEYEERKDAFGRKRRTDLTGSAAAELAGLSGGNVFRKYTGGSNPHRMSEAVWFTMHARSMLPDHQLKEINAAMDIDAQENI